MRGKKSAPLPELSAIYFGDSSDSSDEAPKKKEAKPKPNSLLKGDEAVVPLVPLDPH